MKDEISLIEQLKLLDENAYRDLIDEHKDLVFKIALSFVPFYAEAEDISQEVFIEVFKSIHTFRGDSKLSSWIYKITINKSLNFVKKNNKYFKNCSLEMYVDYEPQNERETNNPLQALYRKEQRKIITEALNKLPERQRISFTLSKIDGFSYQEISQIMSISVSSVESLIHRAKLTLQKLLANYYQKNKKD